MPTRSLRRKEARARRRRKLLAAVAGLAVAAGGMFYLLDGHQVATFLPGAPGAAAQTAALIQHTEKPCPAPAGAVPAGSAARSLRSLPPLIACPQAGPAALSLSAPSPATGQSPAPRRSGAARPRATGSPAASQPAASQPTASQPAASPSADVTGTAAQQVLALINQARGQAGLPAYTMTSGLDASAAAHNARMAGGCGLSHQCPGEPALGARETAAGVRWTAAGENIGEGGPAAASTAAITQLAVTLTQDMLNEQPPDDGHRQNILSSAFRHIGIAVVRDSRGNVWLTQDFSN